MKTLIRTLVTLFLFMPCTSIAEDLSMNWGLENEWSYRKTIRTYEEDGASHPEGDDKEYLTFAFNNRPEVLDMMLECIERHFHLWEQYKSEIEENDLHGESTQEGFQKYKSEKDTACTQHAKQQAPVLYFDFISSSEGQYTLEAIEIKTLRFSEYRGGGFFHQEAWYDIVLSHEEGTKRYDFKDKRVFVFKDTGRCTLRFWSDNFDEGHGWIAPMGEYFIDIKFIFSHRGKEESVSTGLFKMDV